MKFLVAFAFLLVAVAAQTTAPPHNENTGRALLEALEKRAEGVLASAKKVVAAHKDANAHLLAALEHQVTKLETLVADVKKQLAETGRVHHLHHVHVIEEELFYLENRISEELHAIEHATNPDNPPKVETVEQIVARAEKIVAEAKAAITAKPHAKEVADVERELIVIQALVSAVKAKPSPADLKKESQELTRQEKSLQQLIEKINARSH